MDTRFLDSLLSVIEHGSIAEAARHLNLTPAGVAQRVKALEAEIGAPLVARSGRTVRPTAAAMAILPRAQIVQRSLQELKFIAAGDNLAGELRLGVTPSLLCGMIPDLLGGFFQAHPLIEVRIVRNSSSELYPKLLDGQIDAAFTSHPSFRLPKTCEWKLLRREPFVLLTPKSMPKRHPYQVITDEPFIRLDRKVYAGQMIDNHLRKKGIRPNERFEVDGLEAIAIMVDRGLGVAVLPDWAPPWPEGLQLRKIPFPDQSFARHIGLLWMRSSPRLGLVRAFLHSALRFIRPVSGPR